MLYTQSGKEIHNYPINCLRFLDEGGGEQTNMGRGEWWLGKFLSPKNVKQNLFSQ
jgi:hypothetical protein